MKRFYAAIAAIALVCLACGPSPSERYETSSSALISFTRHLIPLDPLNRNVELCLAPTSGLSSGIGAAVGLYACDGGFEQLWTYDDYGHFVWSITNLCLDVGASIVAGDRPVLNTCTYPAPPSQRWTRSSTPSDSAWTIFGGFCLDGMYLVNGSPVDVWPCRGYVTQQWGGP